MCSSDLVFNDNPGFLQFVKNIYTKNAEGYILRREMPPVPTESQLLDMYNKSLKSTAADSKVNTGSKTRPAHINAIMDKYSNKNNSQRKIRNTNTQEELDTDWDSANVQYEDE